MAHNMAHGQSKNDIMSIKSFPYPLSWRFVMWKHERKFF